MPSGFMGVTVESVERELRWREEHGWVGRVRRGLIDIAKLFSGLTYP
ncbi:MAG: hypothetical protein GY812_03600 [Actinomycetia bacterium]|nr:hypothetical protein [Actinomycetes bacterium]